MRNRFLACLCALLLVCVPMAHAEPFSGIASLMDMYGEAPSEEVQAWMADSYAPETVDFAGITITFSEVLCDGRWLYTAARAVPQNPQEVLLVPGSAWLEDRVSGGYGEALRGDDRTFTDAAFADGKRLVCVSVYPQLLNDLPEYFIDHFQLAEDVSVLLSGGMVSLEGETLRTDWAVKVYEVDPRTGNRIEGTIQEALFPLEAPILTPMERREYAATEDAPFETMTLIKTPLAVYTEPRWTDEEDSYRYGYTLLDANGAELPEGASSETRTFSMEALPDTLTMVLADEEGAEANRTLVLEAK